tara:strand:+ start:463 stop:630 length:168 start_codon:yes stop_codon:yes gene_type:complete
VELARQTARIDGFAAVKEAKVGAKIELDQVHVADIGGVPHSVTAPSEANELGGLV